MTKRSPKLLLVVTQCYMSGSCLISSDEYKSARSPIEGLNIATAVVVQGEGYCLLMTKSQCITVGKTEK